MYVFEAFHSIVPLGRSLTFLGGSGLGAVGLGRLWGYLKSRQQARVRLDTNVLSRENALWREIGELKAQVHALEVKLATDARVRDWLVNELSGCRLMLLLTMGEVNAECAKQGHAPPYDLRHESQALRERVPPQPDVPPFDLRAGEPPSQ